MVAQQPGQPAHPVAQRPGLHARSRRRSTCATRRPGRSPRPTASPVAGGRHVAHHGFGYTRYTHDMDGVELDQTVFVAPDDPVKLSLLTLTNRTGQAPVADA